MGDRTTTEFTMDAESIDREYLAVLANTFMRAKEYDAENIDDAITDGILYLHDSRYVGDAQEIADSIVDVMKKHNALLPFAVAEDPAYEHMGEKVSFDPEHGFHTMPCDGNGITYVTSGDIEKAIAETADRDELVAKLNALLGANQPA